MPINAEAPARPAAEAIRVLIDLLAGLDNANGSGEGNGAGTTRADILAGLTELRTLLQEVARWEPLLISAARDRGASWAEIAPALGLASRQAAERRYLRLEHQTGHAGLTGDQRVQATRDRRAGDRAVAGWARDNSAALRGLAGQITALEGLDPATRACVDRIRAALGENDTAALIEPLAEVAPRLATTHSALADQLAAVAADTTTARRQTSPAKKEDAP